MPTNNVKAYAAPEVRYEEACAALSSLLEKSIGVYCVCYAAITAH